MSLYSCSLMLRASQRRKLLNLILWNAFFNTIKE